MIQIVLEYLFLVFGFTFSVVIVNIISLKYLIVLCLFIFSTDFVALAVAGWGILHEGLTAGLQSVLAFLVVVLLIWVGVSPVPTGLSLGPNLQFQCCC